MAYPVLAEKHTWFRPSDTTIKRSDITKIIFQDTYTPNGTEVSWDASASSDGSVMAYLQGTEITIAGNGSGKIAANTDSRYMFADGDNSDSANNVYFTSLTAIENIGILDTSNVTTMRIMFTYAPLTGELDLSTFDTSKVEDMQSMFYGCSELTSITGLENWNTSACTNMTAMFYRCSGLSSLAAIENWNTSACTKMRAMFYDCTSLTSLDLHKWDVSKVTSFDSMFGANGGTDGYQYNGSLRTVDVSGWNVTSCTSMNSMFSGQRYLTTVPIETWKNANACTDMGWMFWGCVGLRTIDLSNFDTSNVVSFHHLFAHNMQLKEIKGLADLDVSSAVTMNAMLHNTKISVLDVSKWDTSNVENFSQFLESNSTITHIIGLEKINTSKVKACGEMFQDCKNLKELNLSTFNTTQVNESWIDPYRNEAGFGMKNMFRGMTGLEKITLGETFSFDGDGTCVNIAALPIPSSDTISETRGKWYNVETLETFSSANIPNRTAATYVCKPIDVLVKHTTLSDFVDATRKVTGIADKQTLSTAISALNEALDNNDLYDAGFEAGKKAEWSAFWDNLCENGNKKSFYTTFREWNAETFKPKYDLIVNGSAYMMFAYFDRKESMPHDEPIDFVELLENCGVVLDFSKCTNFQYAFWQSQIKRVGVINTTSAKDVPQTFQASRIETIDKFILKNDGSQTFNACFQNCFYLKNIVIEGVIGNDISFAQSNLLTHDSLMSIINALGTVTTKKTLTLHANSKAILTDAEKAIATQKGWTLA